jgi:geranylgeranyl diphosphate synthase type I
LSNPLETSDLRARVQATVDAEISTQSRVLSEIGDDLTPLVTAVDALLQGGKRLRAAFLYWGYRAGGGPDNQAVIRAATAMEFFQAAALLHDDVMDDSDIRRGMPAAHRRLADEHAAAGWSGSSDRFGIAGAILAGNLCLTWSDELFATSGLPPAELTRARPVFDRMRTQLMGGQFLDLLDSVRGWDELTTEQRIARARNVIRYKSAKYTIEDPCSSGPPRPMSAQPTVTRSRPMGSTSARRSSFGTTCWGSSETLTRPANRPATTCARASAQSWSR